MPACLRAPLLHARARGAGLTVTGLVVLAVGVATCAHDRVWAALAVVDRPSEVVLVLFASVLVAVLASRGLGGADEELERSTAVDWPVWRAGHLALLAVTSGALLAVGAHRVPAAPPTWVLVSASVGMLGVAVAAAVALGAARSWLPPLGYGLVLLVTAPEPAVTGTGASWQAWSTWWSWPVLVDQDMPGLVPAVTVAALGAVLFVVRGAARRAVD